MMLLSRYVIRHIFMGFAAAAGVLIPLFTTFNLINELDDVSPGGYRWTQALWVMLMTAPRSLIDLGPFIALIGGIVGLGQLSKSLELTAMRIAGWSIFKISLAALAAGVMLTVSLAALDEWVASPLQQRALQLKAAAVAEDPDSGGGRNALWARRVNEFATVKTLDAHQQPVGVEIFYYLPDLSLASYIFAAHATVLKDGSWMLHGVRQKRWQHGQETLSSAENLRWRAIFSEMNLAELTLPGGSFSIHQLRQYIHYLDDSGQPSAEYRIALWQRLGRPILTLAMILLAIPFTFSAPRSPGLGSRLACGVIVGLLTYISYQIIVNLGLLLALNVPLTTLAAPGLLLLGALLLIYRFDKRH